LASTTFLNCTSSFVSSTLDVAVELQQDVGGGASYISRLLRSMMPSSNMSISPHAGVPGDHVQLIDEVVEAHLLSVEADRQSGAEADVHVGRLIGVFSSGLLPHPDRLGISWLRSTPRWRFERHQSVLSSPPVICGDGTPNALHSSEFPARESGSKSRTGTSTSSGREKLEDVVHAVLSFPLPVEPSISESQPISSAFSATMRATSWRGHRSADRVTVVVAVGADLPWAATLRRTPRLASMMIGLT